MAQPLEGFLVVEMTIAVQGPAAGLYLRDMGADVIKVEPPLGDPSRYGRGRGNDTPEGTMGPQYVAVNRGKRSLCIDLTTDLGRRAINDLLDRADVFLTNYRAAALDALGLGYESLRKQHPNLIYASVNGFGPTGDDVDRAMLDGAAIARGGLASMTGHADRPPTLPGAIIADTSGAMQLALGAVTALLARERHGAGQSVQTSALGTQLWLQQWELTHVAMTGADLDRDGSHHPIIRGPYGAYATRDGGAIIITQTMDEDSWEALCVFGGDPELGIDPRCGSPGLRLGEGLTDADSDAIRTRMRAMFERHTAQEWDEFLRVLPEVIFDRVHNWHDVLNDPQNHANGYLTEVNVANVGTVRTVGNTVTLSETPGSAKGSPPELGEANQEVLGNLGFSTAEIEQVARHADAIRLEALTLLAAAREAAQQTTADAGS